MSAAKHIRQMTSTASPAGQAAQVPQAAAMSRVEYQRAVMARSAGVSQAQVASGAYSAQQASAYSAPARQLMVQASAPSGIAAQPAAQIAAQPAAQQTPQTATPAAAQPAALQSTPVTSRSSSPAASSALNREAALIAEWIGQVRFKPKAIGGVDEADVWRKFSELNDRYEQALLAERARYDALLAERLAQQANISTTRRAPAPHPARDPVYAGRRA